MPVHKIVSRWYSAKVLFEHETTEKRQASGLAMRDAMEAACSVRANLAGANLAGAYLARANLAGANLADGLQLVGDRPVLMIGPIGSRSDTLVAYLTDQGIRLRTGCYFGTDAQFEDAVIEEHADVPQHCKEYLAALTLIRAHAEQWMPAARSVEQAPAGVVAAEEA